MNSLRNTRVLIPGTCKCYLYGKGSSQVRSWMGKSILDYLGGALTVITDTLVKGRQRERDLTTEGDVTTEAKCS